MDNLSEEDYSLLTEADIRNVLQELKSHNQAE